MWRLIWATLLGILAVVVLAIVWAAIKIIVPLAIYGGLFIIVFATVITASRSQK